MGPVVSSAVSSCFFVEGIGATEELSTRPPGIENPTTADVGRAFFPVDAPSSFFNSEAQDFFTVGATVAGIGGAGDVASTSVASTCRCSTTTGVSAGTVVDGVEGDFTFEGDPFDIEVREDIGEAGVAISWTEGVAAVVSVTGDEECDVCVWTVGGSPGISAPLSRSGSSGMLTATWTGVSGGVGILRASSTTCCGGHAREEIIIAGAAEGSVGLRDHIASSFLDFSTDEVAKCFVTSGEVITGDDSSGDGVEGMSEGWGTGSVMDTGSGMDTGSVEGSGAGSKIGSGAGSGAGSDICSTS